MNDATLLTHPQLDVGLRPQPHRYFLRLDSPAARSSGGVIYPDVAVPSVSQGVIEARGADTEWEVGRRVMIVPASGSMLSVCSPRLRLPDEILEIDEDDILAIHGLLNPQTTLSTLPRSSLAVHWAPIARHVLIRTYSPATVRSSGIITEKNTKFPRVWGHLLRVAADVADRHPELEPGRFVHFDRFADELLGYDARSTGETDLPVAIVKLDAIKCVLYDPIPVTLEVA
jgi:co-chaperonin GroES (HSP10)